MWGGGGGTTQNQTCTFPALDLLPLVLGPSPSARASSLKVLANSTPTTTRQDALQQAKPCTYNSTRLRSINYHSSPSPASPKSNPSHHAPPRPLQSPPPPRHDDDTGLHPSLSFTNRTHPHRQSLVILLLLSKPLSAQGPRQRQQESTPLVLNLVIVITETTPITLRTTTTTSAACPLFGPTAPD